MSETMICLVSDQAAPNLQAGLARNLAIGSIVLVASDRMMDQASRLKSVFMEHGKKCRIEHLNDPYDARALLALFDKLLKSEDRGSLIVNVTGGTKLMALAAASVARDHKVRCLYVQQNNGKAQWLDSNKPPEDLDAHLSCHDMLAAYGFQVVSRSKFEPGDVARSLADRLAIQATRNKALICNLNTVTHVNKKPKHRDRRTEPFDISQTIGEIREIFTDAAAAPLVEQVTETHVSFRSDYARSFFCGEWLEFAVENALRRLSGKYGLNDIQRGVNVRTDAADVENELDVIFIRAGMLHVVECKTAKFGGSSGPKAGDLIYKLADQRKYGGLTTKRLLVSHHSLDTHAHKRADGAAIHVISGAELCELDAALCRWLDA